LNGGGAASFTIVQDVLEKLTIKKIGKFIINDLKQRILLLKKNIKRGKKIIIKVLYSLYVVVVVVVVYSIMYFALKKKIDFFIF
jgi:hypothetical protein